MAVSQIPVEPSQRVSPSTLFRALGSDVDSINLRDVIRKLWRRKTSITTVTILGTVLAMLYIMQMTPRYTATASVMVDPRQNQTVDFQAVLSGLPADQATIESEIQVLQSRSLAERVVKRLRLYEDPEFNGRLRAPTFKTRFLKSLSLKNLLPADVQEILSLNDDAPPDAVENILMRERIALVDGLLSRLLISRVGRSRVIAITVLHTEPARASEIANTVADLYIVEQLEAKFEATRRAAKWLNDRLTGLRSQVNESESAVESYRKSSRLIEGKGTTIASQQMGELNSQLIVARGARAEATARLRQVSELLNEKNGAESAAEVLNSPLIQGLRGQEAEIQRRAAELSQEFGEKHPKMINIRAEIGDLKSKISAEVRKIVQGLRNEVEVAEAREQELTRGLEQLEARVASLNQREVQLRALEREAEANRALYETFLTRFKETQEQEDIQRPDARIISRAETPSSPTAPRKRLLIFVAFILSACAGVALAFVVESLDRGYRSTEDVESDTGIPAIGLVPIVSGSALASKKPHDLMMERPNSAYAESVRALHASILLSSIDTPPKIIMFSSSVPGEGKTTLSISFARTVAQTGDRRVLLLDCDFRRPVVHKHLDIDPGPGLLQIIVDGMPLQDALRRDPISNAFILTAGGAPSNPIDFVSSESFAKVLNSLRNSFDLIVIDSSPVIAVSDSRVLGRLVDKSVFVVRWAETRREVVRHGIKQLIDAHVDLAGIVLSRVNVKKHAKYGYGDSGSYYGKHQKYYSG